jgi:hypothetical protein
MRATPHCAAMDEWFLPGTLPPADTWESDGVVKLPGEYAEWAHVYAAAPREPRRAAVTRGDSPSGNAGLRITSPADGDRYWIPGGEEARYATIALRATTQAVRWSVDGHTHGDARLALVPGEHVIRAVAQNGESAAVRIRVERQ